jgi:hypothetical protein
MVTDDDFMFLDPPYDCIFSDYGNEEYRGCTIIFRLTGYGGSVISANGVADYVGSFATACGKKTDYVGSSADGVWKHVVRVETNTV